MLIHLSVCILLINAIAVLSEDRFLARSTNQPLSRAQIFAHVSSNTFYAVNLSPASYDPAFGAGPDASVKAKIINLIASVRTIMRSMSTLDTHPT